MTLFELIDLTKPRFPQGALSKDQVEKLLRHGAYDILNEEKAGTGEAESNNFVQQDIDSILERCSRTVVHDNTGSQSNAGGGTFSKASFKVSKSPDAGGTKESEDVDIEDPDFWKKMLGDPVTAAATESTKKRRRRTETNYAESAFTRNLDATIFENGSSSSETDEDDEDADTEGDGGERTRWGGSSSESQWSKEDAETLLKSILTYGYGNLPWDEGMKKLEFGDAYNADEVRFDIAGRLAGKIETYIRRVSSGQADEIFHRSFSSAGSRGRRRGHVVASAEDTDCTGHRE